MSSSDQQACGLSTESWLRQVVNFLEQGMQCVLVTIVETKGSTPRNFGAQMIVTADGIWQTIGGGALEFELMARAKVMLSSSGSSAWSRNLIKITLGPDMGQCCGGSLSLLLEKFGPTEETILKVIAGAADVDTKLAHAFVDSIPLRVAKSVEQSNRSLVILPVDRRQVPLFIYGAGHVGRAVVPRLYGLGFEVFLVDVAASRFPANDGNTASHVVAKRPEIIAGRAPAGSVHLVMTHDHALDETICHTILARGAFGFLGLIGSATKKARFVRRLRQAGITPQMLERLVCPIGIAEINGKSPSMVAISIAAQLTMWQLATGNCWSETHDPMGLSGVKDG